MKLASRMKKKQYILLACLTTFALALSGAVGVANSAGQGGPPDDKDNGSAEISGEFSDQCRDFTAHSSKDISHVELHYADGRVEKDESIDSPDYSVDGGPGDEIDYYAIVKSGTTKKRFDCDNGEEPKPQCSDGVDNDGDKKIDHPEDPGCDSPEDNDETDDPTTPQCSDGIDNDGDTKIDADDPGCHTDGDSTNPDSYDPNDDDEVDENGGGDGAFSCRASTLRLEGSAVLGAILGDPFEPFVANADNDPCMTEDGGSPIAGEAPDNDFGTGYLKALFAETDDSEGADATAGVAEVHFEGEPGFITATAVSSSAQGRCVGGQPELTGESTIATLDLNGNAIVVPPDGEHVEIPLDPLATLHLNYQEVSEDGKTLTVRALWLDAGELEPASGDVIVGESIVDFSGNPC